jgi:hypothetical protein
MQSFIIHLRIIVTAIIKDILNQRRFFDFDFNSI